MFSGTGTVAGTAGTVAVLAEVAVSSDSAGGGAVFLKVDYSQCLIFQKLCVEMDFTRTFQAASKGKSRSNI